MSDLNLKKPEPKIVDGKPDYSGQDISYTDMTRVDLTQAVANEQTIVINPMLLDGTLATLSQGPVERIRARWDGVQGAEQFLAQLSPLQSNIMSKILDHNTKIG
jgi:hypothetical protein